MDHAPVKDQEKSLSILNPGRHTLAGPNYLHDLIDWSCSTNHAIEFWTASGNIYDVSYARLDALTSSLAIDILAALKTTARKTKNVIIPVLIPQRPELYISWIAVLKAGAAFCPIADDTPAERLQFILEDVNASLLLTTDEYTDRLANLGCNVTVMKVSQSNLESSPATLSPSKSSLDDNLASQPDSLAYIMYTSGSTGVPKGVKISHIAVCQALLAHDEHIPNFQRFLQFASPTFDVSVFETFFPLLRGATLIGRDRQTMLADLPGTIREMNVDAAELTPTVAATLLRGREAAPGLKVLLTIGEMLTRSVIENFGETDAGPGILYAMYGPTEASIHCTIAAKIKTSSSVHNIGQPLATVTAFIIAPSSERPSTNYSILPQGRTGELAIAGQLASGYLNRAEQTKAAFIDLSDYGTVYRTGDRARVADDGSLEILGRISTGQVKLRGQRLELGEIESVACRAVGVEMAVAIIIQDALVLFCIRDGGKVDIENVRDTCRRNLLRFMVPANIVVLDLSSLPRLPSGKADRKKIEKDYAASKEIALNEESASRDRNTSQICIVVSEELGHQISSTASLWAEGMNSLAAIKIASALREQQIDVKVHELLELENVSEIVTRMKQREPEEHTSRQSSVTLVEDIDGWHDIEHHVRTSVSTKFDEDTIQDILPCNAVQVAMVAETIANTKLNFTNIELRADKGVSLSDVRTAFQRLAQKNEILRTGFASTNDHEMPFVQVVWKQLDFDRNLGLLHPLNIESSQKTQDKFVVCIHHAIYDGWSWDIIMADLNRLLKHQEVAQRPQFRLVCLAQRMARLRSQSASEEYWKAQLASVTPSHLPSLNTEKLAMPEQQVLHRTLNLSMQTMATFTKKLHISSQTVLTTALSMLLSPYTGSSSAIIGLISSGRHLPMLGINEVLGPCLSTLPLCVELTAAHTVKDLLLYVNRLQLEQLDHGYSSLREVLQQAGMSAQEKLFDVLFTWQEGPSSTRQHSQVIEVIRTRDRLDYALVMEAEPTEDQILLKLTYQEAYLPSQKAGNFLDQFDRLVTGIVSKGDLSLSDGWATCGISLSVVVNGQAQSPKPLFDLTSTIRSKAQSNPNDIAVRFTLDFNPTTAKAVTEELSYNALWQNGVQMAKSLCNAGIQPDDIVCVILDKCLDLYMLDLAIIIAGGAFLNVDTRTPPDRIAQIVRDVKCKIVVIGDEFGFGSLLQDAEQPWIPLARLKARAEQGQTQQTQLPVSVDETNLAYGVTTSGTTGVPKAILITRKNLLSNIAVLSTIYPRDRNSRLLQACSSAFDVFVFELFWTWHNGLCLCSARNDVLFRDIEGFINASGVTHLSLTPSVASLINPGNVPKVKFLVTAGEPMNSKVFNNWAERGMYQGYGPAETTNICNVKGPVRKGDLINNVGPVFSNTSVFICAKEYVQGGAHSSFRILPIGVVGEVVIGGEQVARGYANLELSTSSFFQTSYGRLYRSGDIGRLLANGDLVILGRIDDQVKLRGQRIELGDINAAIISTTLVTDAATVIWNKNGNNTRLVSFWIGHDQEQQETISSIYESLETSLPSYMIPDYLVTIESIPLTRQGKIDKPALIQHLDGLDDLAFQQYSRGNVTSHEYEDFTREEKPIAKALSEVANVSISSIGPNTSFYVLGLDSISSVRFSQKLRQFGVGQIDVSTILRYSSVRKLCKMVVRIKSTSTNKLSVMRFDGLFSATWRDKIIGTSKSRGLQVEKFLPCTPLQDSILVSQVNSTKASTYQAQLHFDILGDVSRLKVAWARIVLRHQILRTGFAMTSSAGHIYAQVVLKDFELPWFDSYDIPLKSSAHTEEFLMPPWNLKLSEREFGEPHSLKLTMSHALYDSEALAILLKEVEQTYHSQELGPVISPEVYHQYASSINNDATDACWRSLLRDYSPYSFTRLLSPPGDEDDSTSLQRTYTRLSVVSQKCLQTAAGDYLATTSSLCQAAWGRLLSCYTKRNDIVFGNVFSGRNLPVEGVGDIVAPLFNTLPIRFSVTDQQSMRELVTAVQASVIDIIPLQPSPLRRIIKNQQLIGEPLFDTLVLVQAGDLSLDEDLWTLSEENGDMDFSGVIIEIVPETRKDLLTFKLHVQCDSIEASTAEQILRNYDVLLDDAVRYPQAQCQNFDCINSDLPTLRPVSTVTNSKSHGPYVPARATSEENLSYHELHVRMLFSQFSGIGVEKIRRDASIFELGLDSLHVVQIAMGLRKLGYDVTGADVLEAETIERLSKVCVSVGNSMKAPSQFKFDLQAFDQKHRATVCERLEIQSSHIEAIRPCTSTQSGILTEFLNSNGQLYFNSVNVELNPDVDLERMRKAWQAVMNRHEMLRTGFVVLNTLDHPYGMITYVPGTIAVPWLLEDDFPSPKLDNISQDCLQTMKTPAWRLVLRNTPEVRRLEIYLLHALYDANSFDIIMSGVAAVFQDQNSKLPVAAPIESALCSILDQMALSNSNSGDFWEQMAAGAQSIRFPNINVQQSLERGSITVSKRFQSLLPTLENGCRRLGISLQVVCQVAWARLLASYTGESKVIFGIVLSGRSLPETENAIFPTINTVPFAVDVQEQVDELFMKATNVNTGLFKHQFTPAISVKKRFHIEGTLYDTILVLQKNQSLQSQAPWKLIEDRASAEYMISMEVCPQAGDGIELRMTARQDIIPEEHIHYLLNQYEALLQSLMHENSGKGAIPKSLLSIVTAKDDEIPTKIRLLHDFVEETLAQTPNAIALEFADRIVDGHVEKRCWTYKQLDEESNKIAQLLLSSGVRPGGYVAVCFEKCPEASFAILGVLKAGSAYVAIDPGAPAARKNFILDDAKCDVLLTTKSLHFSLDEDSKVIMLAVDDQTLLKDIASTKPKLERKVEGSDTCYCLYTSGTTGQPKGCLINHNSVVQAMLSFQRIFSGHWDNNSRWLQFASFHFDVSVLEQYWSWSVGICVTSAPRDLLFEDIAGAIDALQITHLDLTPSLARILNPDQVPSLCRGVFIVGGEQVTQDLIDTWGDVGCLYNFYGPSEVTIGCTVHKRVKKGVKATNIGQPWDNVGAFVLEPGSEKAVLRGAVGELCLSGPLVGKGYLNRPDLTAEKFVILKEYNARVYRSGDLVRMLHDDSFEFLGRIDDQVKLRGQRLEIREIDHCLKQADDLVMDVATMVVKHHDQPSEQLAAFFTLRGQTSRKAKLYKLTSSDATETIALVRRKLQESLPAYMVPTHLVPISHLPLSINNKADLKTLRAFFEAMPIRSLQNMDWDGSRIPVTNETTKKIMLLLSDFLRLPEAVVTPSSRLFELGLDSISAVAFASMLRREGFAGADAVTVMRRPVVAELAASLEISDGHDYKDAVKRAKDGIHHFRRKHEDAVSNLQNVDIWWPCTPLQEDMLSKAVYRGEQSYYMSAFHYLIDPWVTFDTIKSAWTQVQEMFPILRTTFFELLNRQHAQIIRQGCVAPVRHLTLKSQEDAMTILEQNAVAWTKNADVLGDLPCWEVDVLQISSRKIYMSLRIFHGLYDANSLLIILSEFAGLIRPRTTQQDKNILNFHQALPYGPLCQKPGAESFWVKHLPTITTLDLLPKQNGDPETIRTHSCDYILPNGYNSLKHNLGATDSAIIQAACLLSLQIQYGRIPALGLVVSGRSFPVTGVEKICGPLFNTIPFQVQPESAWSRGDLIRACHNFNVESKQFEHTTLRDIGRWIGREPGRAMFDTLFVFQRELDDMGDSNNDVWTEVGQRSVSEYPLNFEVNLKRKTLKITIVADSEFLDQEEVRVLCENVARVLQEISLNPDELLMPQEKNNSATRQIEPVEPSPIGDVVDAKILQQVRLQLALLMQQDTETIDDSSNFFGLGLDSIGFIKLSSALRKVGLPVSVNMIMRLSTVASLVSHLTKTHAETSSQYRPLVENEESEALQNIQNKLRSGLERQGVPLDHAYRVWPVTPMQEGVLANFENYYHFSLFKLAPDIVYDRMQSAWVAAIEAHSVFRTTFVLVDDPDINHVFAQLITKPRDTSFESTGISDDEQLRGLVARLGELMTTAGLKYPPFTIKFITSSDTKTQYFLLGMSHALYDGWSIQLLHQDIVKFYNRQTIQRPPIEPYLQRILVRQPGDTMAFWREQLSGYAPKIFPAQQDHHLTEPKSYKSTLTSRTSADELRQFCMGQAVSLQSLGLAIWTMVLSSHLQSRDICFGIVLACRDIDDADQMMFPTFNTVPFRPRFEEGSHLDIVKHVHELSLRIAEHQDIPLKEIKKISNNSTDQSSGLFDTLFVLQKKATLAEILPKLYEEVDLGEDPILDYPLNVEMEVGESLTWTVAAVGHILGEDGVKNLLEQLESTLELILRKPHGLAINIMSTPSESVSKIAPALGAVHEGDELREPLPEVRGLRTILFNAFASVAHCSVETLSDDSSIFALGLDSISVIKVASVLRNRDVTLPVSKIMAAVTLGKIVREAHWTEHIHHPMPAPDGSSTSAQALQPYLIEHGLARDAIEDVLPASAGQLFMLDFYLASAGRLFYPTFRYVVSGVMARDEVLRAWGRVVQVFPALRTRFVEHDGQIWQVVIRKDAIDQYPPAVHLTVTERTQESVIEIQLHHALYDAVGLPMVISAFERALDGEPLPPQNSKSTLRTFIDITRTSDTGIVRKQFWKDYLARYQQHANPSNRGSFAARKIEVVHENAITDLSPLISRAAAADISLQALFLAAVGRAHARSLPLQPNGVVTIGVYLANRGLDVDGLNTLAAPTVGIVPLLVDTRSELRECARKVQEDLARVQRAEYCGVMLREVHAWTKVVIDCFVNFVPRVEERGNEGMYGDGDGESAGAVRIVPYPHETRDGSVRRTEELTSPFIGSPSSNDMPWCVPSVDVEAKLEVGGGLTMGWFAPEDMLSEHGARERLREIREVLMGFQQA